ncbi:MAG: S8 family peptidase [Candidatus Magasanikbacteria bacterium]|nr:S8 family peptidase [Candidatus Magasanikbacteria bacterium]
MHKSYIISGKKSIVWLVAGLFLFLAVPAMASTSLDPEFARQAPVFKQINAAAAWNYTTGSPEIVVAVLDTGVDIGHPDLAKNIWTNEHEIPGNGIDDDGNGYIDDVHGWNFIDKNNNVDASTEATFFGIETISHGTVIAGLIGAIGDNNQFGAGVNWQVKIMPIRAIDNYGSGSYEDLAKAVDYAASNGADIISLSFVGSADEAILYEALRRAYTKNVLIVVAAGNEGLSVNGNIGENFLYPICYPDPEKENWILGVTAVDQSDKLSGFANYGGCVDISAPGENIFSTIKRTADNNNLGFTGPWKGTSFATPLVAGAAALVKSVQPDWGPKKLISTLLASVDNIDKANPNFLGRFGYGRLNVGAAVKIAIKEKLLTGPFANICYPAAGQIYCHSLYDNKSAPIVDLKTGLVTIDSSDRELIAALVKEKNNFTIKTIFKTGVINSGWALEQGINFNLVRVASVNGEKFVYVAGYDVKGKRTKIISFSIEGKRQISWWAAGRVDTFDVNDNGRIFIAGIKNGRLIVEDYDFLGNFQKKFDLGGATRADDISVGNFTDTDIGSDEQIAVISRRGLDAYRLIVYPESGGYLTERLADTKEKWSILTADYNYDGATDLLLYNNGGGIFNIVSGKGNVLKSVQLPRLK